MLNLEDLLKGNNPLGKPNIASNEEQEKLQEKLFDIKTKEIEEETAQKARYLGVPYINLVGFPIPPEALRIIPQEEAQKYGLICFYRAETKIKLASPNVENPVLSDYIEQLEGAYGLKSELYLVSVNSFNKAYRRYATLPKISSIDRGVEISAEQFKSFQKKIKTFQDLNREFNRCSRDKKRTLDKNCFKN